MSTINTPEHRQSLLGTDKMIIPISDADNNNTDEKQHADVIMSANIVEVTKKQSGAENNEQIKTQIDVVALTIEDNKESVTDTFKRLRAHFYTGATRSLQWRRSQLQSLRRMISENVAALENALLQDLKKNAQDSHLTEIGFVLDEIDDALRNVSKWMKPRSVGTNVLNMPGSSEIQKDPLGVVLIIAPWNYPVQLCLAPLVGAIAAGNCAVIKPSDIATATDAVLSSLLPRYMDKKAIATFSGGPAITTELMTCHWDLVFFTGSGMVAKIIAAAAAKNLIRCVLELGGKSPCIVDSSASLDVAVRRIVWGKFLNAGQTCVAPDYILVHESVHDTFVTKMKSSITDFYTSNPAESSDYCNIINANHHGRLSRLLAVVPGEEQKSDWTVECGGLTKIVDGNQRYFPPTVLTNVKPHHRVMEDEIFGPILPVIKYSALPDAIAFINSQPKPLALYIFSENSHNIDRVLSNTSAGGVTINDTLMHVINPNLPFGGVGPSGMGSYHGEKSFTTFTHEKSVLYKSGMNLLDVKARYPPSAPGKTRLMNVVLSTQSAVNAHGRLMLLFFLIIVAGLIALFVTKYAVKLW